MNIVIQTTDNSLVQLAEGLWKSSLSEQVEAYDLRKPQFSTSLSNFLEILTCTLAFQAVFYHHCWYNKRISPGLWFLLRNGQLWSNMLQIDGFQRFPWFFTSSTVPRHSNIVLLFHVLNCRLIGFQPTHIRPLFSKYGIRFLVPAYVQVVSTFQLYQ